MNIILFLIALGLVMAAIGLGFFLWSLRSGQYDDMEGAANRILFEDVPPPPGDEKINAPPGGTR